MRVAEQIKVEIAGEPVTLVPRLRHAMRIERAHGLQTILTGLQETNIGLITDLVSDHVRHPFLVNRVWDARDSLTEPLSRYVCACFGIDPNKEPDQDKPEAEPMTFEAWHSWLYRLGTGWLGWTPQDTLNATPIELAEAYKGRVDMLRSIFGGTEAETKPKANWADRFIRSIKTRKVRKGKADA